MTALSELTPAIAAENIISYLGGSRLRQNIWTGIDRNRRPVACLLAAISPEIRRPKDCPESVMPLWLSDVLSMIFDELPPSDLNFLCYDFAKALRSGTTDEAMRNRWLIRVVQLALAFAASVTDLTPPWWQVVAACNEVIAAIRSGDKRLVEAAALSAKAAASSVRCARTSALTHVQDAKNKNLELNASLVREADGAAHAAAAAADTASFAAYVIAMLDLGTVPELFFLIDNAASAAQAACYGAGFKNGTWSTAKFEATKATVYRDLFKALVEEMWPDAEKEETSP